MKLTPIQQFYHGQNIFITGATGFCGKMLLEKLLRSCPGVGNIYVVIRPKKGWDINERLQILFKEPVFECLKKDPNSGINRVFAIPGDISKPNLGLSEEDFEKICKEVSIVFHAAATIKFNENLKVALETNVMGTQEMVNICKKMPQLRALVYVSTAYSYCPLGDIDEKIYPPPGDPEKLKEVTRWLSPEEFQLIESSVLGKWPNTYSYSKALAENVIDENRESLPVAIFRPSIVISSWKEPVPGWIDNVNGPTLGILGAYMGMIRCGNVSLQKVSDFIPVDMAINALIAAAWETGSNPRKDSTKVYNLVSGAQNPITWGEFIYTCRDHTLLYPSTKCKWYMAGVLCSSKVLYLLISILLEFIPACIVDIIPVITTGKHENVDIYLRSGKFCNLVSYFANREWKFKDDNVRLLLKSLSTGDREIFNFDITELNWNSYLAAYVLGLRAFVLKEDPKTLPSARKRYQKLYAVHIVTMVVLTYLLYLLFSMTGRWTITFLWDLLSPAS